jgi:hypothetical protein
MSSTHRNTPSATTVFSRLGFDYELFLVLHRGRLGGSCAALALDSPLTRREVVEKKKIVPEVCSQSKKEDSSGRNGHGGPSTHGPAQIVQKKLLVYNR